jgi:hypothetical protein
MCKDNTPDAKLAALVQRLRQQRALLILEKGMAAEDFESASRKID